MPDHHLHGRRTVDGRGDAADRPAGVASSTTSSPKTNGTDLIVQSHVVRRARQPGRGTADLGSRRARLTRPSDRTRRAPCRHHRATSSSALKSFKRAVRSPQRRGDNDLQQRGFDATGSGPLQRNPSARKSSPQCASWHAHVAAASPHAWRSATDVAVDVKVQVWAQPVSASLCVSGPCSRLLADRRNRRRRTVRHPVLAPPSTGQ
jgi:hypothetical protein